jgi:hypothetical protein
MFGKSLREMSKTTFDFNYYSLHPSDILTTYSVIQISNNTSTIVDLSTRPRLAARFTGRPLYSKKNNSGYALCRRQGGTQSLS